MALLGLAALFSLGCGGGGKEFPLSVGRAWSYMVSTTFVKRTEEIKVLRRVPVDSEQGYELGGTMGQSRVAWRDGVLVAGQLPNAVFTPPVPLVVAGASKARRDWRGKVGLLANSMPATATLIQEPDTLEIGPKKVKTTRATLTVMANDHRVELVTWYQPGVGPIRQEQRTDGIMDVSMESISGG